MNTPDREPEDTKELPNWVITWFGIGFLALIIWAAQHGYISVTGDPVEEEIRRAMNHHQASKQLDLKEFFAASLAALLTGDLVFNKWRILKGVLSVIGDIKNSS